MIDDAMSFWLGAFVCRMRHCLKVRRDPAPPGLWEGREQWEESPYDTLAKCAMEFGLAAPASLAPIPLDSRKASPSDTTWCYPDGSEADPDDLRELAGSLATNYASAEAGCRAKLGEVGDALLKEVVEEIVPPFAYGRSQTDPRTLFVLNAKGERQSWKEVTPHPRSLYFTLLQQLSGKCAIPRSELLAVGIEVSDDVPPLPVLFGLPDGEDSLEGCESVCAEHQKECGQSLGWRLATALWSVSDAVIGLRSMEYLPELPGMGTDAGESEAPEPEGSGPPDLKPSAFDRGMRQADALPSFVDLLVKLHGLGSQEQQDIELAYQGEKEAIAAFDQTIELAHEAALPHVVSILSRIKQDCVVPPAAWAWTRVSTSRLEIAFQERRERLPAVLRAIEEVEKLAYGELRLRALLSEETTLTDGAITGWMRQNENIRAAIKVGSEQLANGLRPFVVLSQVSPAAEALVRQLAAKHLAECRGLNAGGLLHALRNTIGLEEDESDVRSMLGTAQALVSLRNWVLHKPSSEWGRDHAAFFLNGLSILLREV